MDSIQVDGAKRSLRLPLKATVPADGGLKLARVLLLGMIVALLPSTSVAAGFELATYIAFAVMPEPRRRLWQAMHQPVVIGLLPFAAALVIATFHGPASWHDALGALDGWRRLFLLPFAAALFDDQPSKRLVCKVMVITCVVGALVSFATAWKSILITDHLPPGIVFHNYAVQGLVFSVAITICIAAILRPEAFAGDRLLGDRRIMAIIIAMLFVDIVFVLWGRSGYVSVIIMTVVMVTLLAPGPWRARTLAGFSVFICIGVVLASSSQVRNRVGQAFHEIETAEQAPKASSLGYRVAFWPNTLRMIRDHPILGVGTGGFQDGYRPYIQGVTGWRGGETGDPHNQFLKIFGEQGLIGFAAFLFFLFRALTCPAQSPYRELASAALVSWCVTSLANSHFSTYVEGHFVYFWLGAMLATPLAPSAPQEAARAGAGA